MSAWVQGYWQWDWADSIVRINGTGLSGGKSYAGGVLWAGHGPVGGPPLGNARYIGLNILAELDAGSEYYIDPAVHRIHYLPRVPLAEWASDPVLSLHPVAVNISGASWVTIDGLVISHSKAVGVLADGVENVEIRNCTVTDHGATAITLTGKANAVVGSIVRRVGCRGMTVHAGVMRSLEPGNSVVTGNTITAMALYKRAYQPGLH